MRIDLHTHSHLSDGTESPGDVMRSAHAAGLDVVALTDHDSCAGWDEARAVAEELGLRFVPGTEVSCRDRGVSIHMLSYWHRLDDPEFVAMTERTREARVSRAQTIVEKIARDYPVTWDDVIAAAGATQTVGRPHIADALVALEIVPNRDEAFTQILANNSRYFVPHYAPEVNDAIRALRAAGGVPVFAHPGADGRGRVVPDSVIDGMVEAGLVGLEVDHRDHSAAQRERLAGLAAAHGLVRTGASDYHGTGKLNRLGENLTTPEALAALEAARG